MGTSSQQLVSDTCIMYEVAGASKGGGWLDVDGLVNIY
jgi:hypothetical protein